MLFRTERIGNNPALLSPLAGRSAPGPSGELAGIALGAILLLRVARWAMPVTSNTQNPAGRNAPAAREYLLSTARRLTSRRGRKNPDFIMSIKAVPPAMGRTDESSGSSNPIASRSERGSAISNGVVTSSSAAKPKLRIV